MTTPILETDRILLRPPRISDAKAVFENWASDSDATKYVRWNTHRSINDTVEWLKFEERDIENPSIFSWIFVNKENEIFGSSGLFCNDDHGMLEIGYIIMKKFWNRGFASEAAAAMVDYAVKKLNQGKIFARHAVENFISGKVLIKAGFVYQSDGEYSSFDGKRVFKCKEYAYTATTEPSVF